MNRQLDNCLFFHINAYKAVRAVFLENWITLDEHLILKRHTFFEVSLMSLQLCY